MIFTTNRYTNKKKREQLRTLRWLLVAAGALYVLGILTLRISPFWTEEADMKDTVIFAIVTILLGFCVMLYKRQNGVEERLAARYKRSLDKAKQSLNKRRTKS